MTAGVPLGELEELFHRVVALSAPDRRPFLDRTCAQPAVRAQLERMVEADERASEILDCERPDNVSAVECPSSIGRWNLLERIGSGGLGVVYRAWCECDGVTLHAAVKTLRPGLDVLLHASFIQERNIVAGLDHPYIARLIDAGAGVCGTSFLAMEFVEGVSLDVYLDQRRPALRDRLQLFNRICEAVDYLHEHGIIHGDLKPSNVIVRSDRTPKLLDFGTARLIDRGREACESWTRLMMTPAYASPEQMSGLGPSMAGDVYSLGCVLRDIIGRDRVDGDLAAVLDRCLASRPHQRYESARAVAADIENHFKHRPVRARRASPRYLLVKFIRRNRIAGGLTTLVVASVVTGGLASRHQAMRAQQSTIQLHSVVAHLVRDEPLKQAPDSQQRASYVAGVGDAIAQMERLQPPPLADLASAWRRLSYSQAASGQTGKSIASIERSILWARRDMEVQGTPDARRQLADSLLHAAFMQQRRGRMAPAGELALEVVHLTETLPSRAQVERTPQFVRALWLAARRRALLGDIEEGRTLLRRSIELGRTMGKRAQLRSTLDLVWLERAAHDERRVTTTCAEAKSLRIATVRLARLCGGPAGAAGADREALVASESAIFERQLRFDPDRYRFRLQLARHKLQLARFAADKQEPLRAQELVDEARAFAGDLLRADPENQNLHRLMTRIEGVRTRLGAR
jgi:serine/threonine protein kinase